MNNIGRVLFLTYLILLSYSSIASADTASTVQLARLRSFSVVVIMKDYSMNTAFSPENWQKLIQQISKRVKNRIQKDGFKVEIIETDHDIYLNSFEIDIDLHDNPTFVEKGLYAFNVSANFRDDVRSKRIPYGLPEGGVTWNRSIVGFENKRKLDKAVIKAVDGLTETFVNALLFENGKEIDDERERKKTKHKSGSRG